MSIDPTQHISSQMRDTIAGTYDLTMFDRDNPKLAFLFGLQEYYNAMQRIGWAEHTSDWDWAVEGKANNTPVGDNMDDEDYELYCDTFRILLGDEPLTSDNFPHELNFDYSLITVEFPIFEPGDVDSTIVTLNQLTEITITER